MLKKLKKKGYHSMKKNEQLHQSMDYVFRGGVATSAMDSLAVGSTLTAYALLLGAGPVAIGILGAVPFIGNMIHLLSSYLIEKGISAKKNCPLVFLFGAPFLSYCGGPLLFSRRLLGGSRFNYFSSFFLSYRVCLWWRLDAMDERINPCPHDGAFFLTPI